MESSVVERNSEYYVVLLCAVRYACDRKSYMPGHVINWIKENEPNLPETWAKQMIDDIEFQRKHGGGLGDEKIWEEFIVWLKSK